MTMINSAAQLTHGGAQFKAARGRSIIIFLFKRQGNALNAAAPLIECAQEQ